MRILYVLRVSCISFEALVIAIALLMFNFFSHELQVFAVSIELNEEFLKYLMLLPIVLAVWVINETRVLLQEDKETIRTLTAWPDYWKLKVHTWICIGYAVMFAFISFVPWATKSGVSTSNGLLIFITSIVGQLTVAISVYAARIRIKEIISHM